MSLEPHLPLVSIVTPSYNMAKYLPETIESVLSQDYPRLEYIVVDGGSTDGSVEILERYRSRLRYTVAVDAGPADAIHSSFSRANGEVFAWLGADDTYLPGAVRTGVEYLVAHPDVDVVYGEGYWIDREGSVIGCYPTLPFDAAALKDNCFICQPASFIRASSYRRCGLDPAKKLTFDYDLWIRMAKRNFRFHLVPHHLANARMHREAITIRCRREVLQASIQLLRLHYGYVPFPWILAYTAHCLDGRDQFFEPFRSSPFKIFATLLVGLRHNPLHGFRFLREWFTVSCQSLRGLVRRRRESRS